MLSKSSFLHDDVHDTVSLVGCIKPINFLDFSPMSDVVTFNTVTGNRLSIFGIILFLVTYTPVMLGTILGSKSPSSKALMVEHFTKRTFSERAGIVVFSHNRWVIVSC